MSILHKLFGGSEEQKKEKSLPWIALTTLEQLSEIEALSKTKTQIIFKHSTRCGISRMVLKQFEADYNVTENNLDLHYLDLLNYRNISNDIASKFQIMHESPQLLVIKNGIVVAHESHGGINDLDLSSYI